MLFKNWKQFQCYQKSKKKTYTPLSYVHHSLKEKANKKIAQSAQSVHCAQSAVGSLFYYGHPFSSAICIQYLHLKSCSDYQQAELFS